MRHKTSRLQSFFLQGMGMPNQGFCALVPTPTSPFSPLGVFQSSLEEIQHEWFLYSRRVGLSFWFFSQAALGRLFNDAIQGCRDAGKITNKGSAGLPGQTSL